MGIITKEVKIKLWGKTVKYYNDLGYEGKYGDVITVKVEDLPKGSNVKIKYLCDYCEKEVMTMPYADYTRRTKEVNKMACKHCYGQKVAEVFLVRYGVSHYSKTEDFKEKYHKTCSDRYGESYRKQFMDKAFETFRNKTGYNFPTQSPEVMKKNRETCLDKFGYEYALQAPEVREKAAKTIKKIYNVDNVSQSVEIDRKKRSTCFSHYGFEYSMQSPEVRQKSAETMYRNGTVSTSCQQLYIYNFYKNNLDTDIQLNYPISGFLADICFTEEMIDLEIDFGGHDLSVKLGSITQEEFNQKEIIRNKIIKHEGYKIIRYVSPDDVFPSDETLLQILNKSKEYFVTYPNHSWIEWDFNTSIVRNAEYRQGIPYDYGELRKIKSKDLEVM